ncbi:MAG TPA: prolyl oligopeptidase family serine peptidase [Vicinamibacterales bacterium]|nr:prolyl oligopeptidase family serine peptidase [Vicinamibacterales bacterium]
MRNLSRAALLALLLTPIRGQGAILPVPPDVTTEGVPPIPQAIADSLSRYANFTSAQLLAWHPTRREILLVTRLDDAPKLYTVEAPGRPPHPLNGVPVSTSVWAGYDPANPGSIVYVKDASAGAEAYNLYRLDPATATSTLLTDGKSRYAAPPLSAPVWARQGKWIAYDSTERNGTDRDLYVMPPSNPAAARRIAQVEGIWIPQDWSPDGTALLATNEISSGSISTLWRIDVRTGARHPIAPLKDNAYWGNARFTANGRSVVAISTRAGGVGRIWRSSSDGTWNAISPEQQEVSEFELSPDGRMAAMIVDRGDSDELRVIDIDNRKPRRMPPLPPGVLSHLLWRPGSREIGFTIQTEHTFGDVFSIDVATGTLTRWTKSEAGGFDPDVLPAPQVISWRSFDGRTISGLLYRPAARFTGPRPVMINLHGGPQLRARSIFVGRSNYFLNELGVAIIYPNYRGSSGFGEEFAAADDGMKRSGAVKDIGALLDWIGTNPALDKDRIMLTGASYGGFLALEAGAEYNDRIRCIYEGVGQTNLVTYLERTDPSRQNDRRTEYGDERNPAMRTFLLSISPVTHASLLKKPLAIVHPGNDTRVPVSQARELIAAVSANGTPVWYMEYANAGHDSFPRNRADDQYNFACWIEFVKRYLLN